MGVHGYTLSDRWFPWTVASEDKSKGVATLHGNPDAEPGVVVYTKGDDADDRLVVLVVGENPTTGFRVKALEVALGLAAVAPTGEDETIRLVGPFFTGSQATLGRTILRWAEQRRRAGGKHLRIRCVSGTALGLKPWGGMWNAGSGRIDAVCNPITGTQIPFDSLNRAVLHYLSKPGPSSPDDPIDGHPAGKVAYLVEANSGYGEAAAEKARDCGSPVAGGDQRGAAAAGSARDRLHLVFRFPMHIGRLAGLRSKEERERDQRLGLIKPGEAQLAALDEGRSGGDLVPAADETRTALINQRLLDDYWSAIRRERVRYVFVVATDKRDDLFLLEQLQTACPDAQPVVFGADLHYAHPDYLRFTRGVVIVGTYPLYLRAQRWQAADRDDPRWIPFPSSNAEGVYNAVLKSLGEEEHMADYRPPGFGPEGQKKPRKPPVWVTTVGENGAFVPLAYFTGHPEEGDFLVSSEEPANQAQIPTHPFPRSFLYLAGLIVAAVLVGALYVWRRGGGPRAEADRAAEPAWAPGVRASYVLLAAIGAVFATLPLVLSFGSADLREDFYARGLFVAASLLVVLVPAATFGALVREWRQAVTRLGSPPAPIEPPKVVLDPWQSVALALLVAGVVAGWLLGDYARLPEAAWRLFAERAADPFSGFSPVVPAAVIALGLLGYALLGLKRTRLMTEYRFNPPYPDWRNGPPPEMQGRGVVLEAVCRIRNSADEIDSQSRVIAGVFADPGEGTGGWWLRPLAWAAAGLLTVFVVVWPAQDGEVQDWRFFYLGYAVTVLSIVLCMGVLVFAWRKEPRVAVGRPRLGGSLLLVAAGVACAIALHRSQPTWEGHAWDCLFATGFLALAFLTLVAGYRLYLLWKQVERMTRAIAAVPMAGAFDRFPHKVSQVLGAYLLSARRHTLDLAIPAHMLCQLREALWLAEAAGDERARVARAAIGPDGPPGAAGRGDSTGGGASALCEVAARLVGALAVGWEGSPVPQAFGTVPPEAGKEAEPLDGWRGLAEQFVAIMAILFLSQFLIRIRCLASMAITASASLLIAITAYQFEPERFLMYTAVGFAGSVIVLLVWVLYRINRNELVSRVTRTTPDRFQLDAAFVQNVAVLVLPLLAVVVTQLAGRMRSVVEPILGWLR